MDRNIGVGGDVEPAPGTGEEPLLAEPAQVFRVDATRSQVPDTQNAHAAGEVQDFLGCAWLSRHVYKY